MHFTKMEGLGNDFMIVDAISAEPVADWPQFAIRYCRRHFGVGSDGVLLMERSSIADAKMTVYNADGSIAQMCGNGLRCAARFLVDQGLVSRNPLHIETGAGILSALVEGSCVTCDMGVPVTNACDIPVNREVNRFSVDVCGEALEVFCVSMGNPHAVIFSHFPDDEAFFRLGPAIEHHEAFPERINVEFCRMTERGLEVRVWERGDGETLACGTGACAVFTAAHLMGLVGDEAEITLRGGQLSIRLSEDGHILMRGPAEYVFEGEI